MENCFHKGCIMEKASCFHTLPKEKKESGDNVTFKKKISAMELLPCKAYISAHTFGN